MKIVLFFGKRGKVDRYPQLNGILCWNQVNKYGMVKYKLDILLLRKTTNYTIIRKRAKKIKENVTISEECVYIITFVSTNYDYLRVSQSTS